LSRQITFSQAIVPTMSGHPLDTLEYTAVK
jgi:hypothetical protein